MGRRIDVTQIKAKIFEYPPVVIPEDERCRKIAVVAMPLLGAMVGVGSVDQMEERLKAVPAGNRQLSLSLAKVIHEYHGAISLNTFFYGTLTFACSYGVGSAGLLYFGVVQVFASFHHGRLKRVAQRRVEQLSDSF